MSGRCRNDYFQLLLMEYLRRYNEKVPRRGLQLYPVRNLELVESDCIHILRLCRDHNDEYQKILDEREAEKAAALKALEA